MRFTCNAVPHAERILDLPRHNPGIDALVVEPVFRIPANDHHAGATHHREQDRLRMGLSNDPNWCADGEQREALHLLFLNDPNEVA